MFSHNKKSTLSGFFMVVCGALLLVLVPHLMRYVTSYVDTSQGATNSWWRLVWYTGMGLGYLAYILIIAGVLLLLVTFLNDLRKAKK